MGLPRLNAVGVVIPGSRSLCRAETSVGEQFLVDLEVGPSFLTRAVLDCTTGRIVDERGHTGWHVNQLVNAWKDKNSRHVTVNVEVRKRHDRVVVLNTIDDLYGHSLLRMLNASRHLDNDDIGLCVLVQPHLRLLVPPSASEVWCVDIPSCEGVDWFDSLDSWLQNRFKNYRQVFLSRCYPHLRPKFYRLSDFYNHFQIADYSGYSPVICFQWRDDRPWGGTVAAQSFKLRRLYHELKWRFPNFALVVVGFSGSKGSSWDWPGVFDLRVTELKESTEIEWFAAMKAAHTSVGVHGSNMLSPSGLSKYTVELLPTHKYPVIGTTFLDDEDHMDPRIARLRKNYIFGDDSLIQVSAERVAQVIACQYYSESLEPLYSFSPQQADRGMMDEILANGKAASAITTVKPSGLLGQIKKHLRNALYNAAFWLE